jgi:NADH dehydrogenase
VARFLFLSSPGASASSPNAYLRAKGLAEDAVRSSGLDHLILRSTHVYGPGQRWFEDMLAAVRRLFAAPIVGNGRQRIAPAHVHDVASALLAADDRAEPVTGTRGLEGPDVVTVDELVDLLAGRHRRTIHLSPYAARRAARLLGRSMHPALLEILAADSLADAPDAAAELGLTLTPLVTGISNAIPVSG